MSSLKNATLQSQNKSRLKGIEKWNKRVRKWNKTSCFCSPRLCSNLPQPIVHSPDGPTLPLAQFPAYVQPVLNAALLGYCCHLEGVCSHFGERLALRYQKHDFTSPNRLISTVCLLDTLKKFEKWTDGDCRVVLGTYLYPTPMVVPFLRPMVIGLGRQ
jgi:hypothetical protein